MLDLSDLQPLGDGHLPSWRDPLEASALWLCCICSALHLHSRCAEPAQMMPCKGMQHSCAMLRARGFSPPNSQRLTCHMRSRRRLDVTSRRKGFTDSAAHFVTQICTCVQLLHLYAFIHME